MVEIGESQSTGSGEERAWHGSDLVVIDGYLLPSQVVGCGDAIDVRTKIEKEKKRREDLAEAARSCSFGRVASGRASSAMPGGDQATKGIGWLSLPVKR
jgi:hypothetical protein